MSNVMIAIGSIPSVNDTSLSISIVLSFNLLHGTIPSTLGAYGQYNSTVILDISYNDIHGSIPYEWADMDTQGVYTNVFSRSFPSLKILSLAHNRLNASITAGGLSPLINHHSLILIDLSHNQFMGNLPSDFIYWNWHGDPSTTIGFIGTGFQSLVILSLSHTNITGQLPLSLPSSVYYVDISHTNVSGPIPDTSSYTQLVSFQADHTSLSDKTLPHS